MVRRPWLIDVVLPRSLCFPWSRYEAKLYNLNKPLIMKLYRVIYNYSLLDVLSFVIQNIICQRQIPFSLKYINKNYNSYRTNDAIFCKYLIGSKYLRHSRHLFKVCINILGYLRHAPMYMPFRMSDQTCKHIQIQADKI